MNERQSDRTLILYTLANKLTTAANAIFLQETAPLYLLLVSPLWLRERVERRDLGFVLALLAGLALIFAGREDPQSTAPDPLLGNWLGACSGVTWCLTIAGLRWLARGPDPEAARASAAAASIAGNLLAAVVCLPLALPVEAARPVDLLWVAYLGVFQIALGYALISSGIRRIRALEAALLLLVEPVLNTLLTWWIHGEAPGPWSRAGCGVILLATLVHAVAASRTGSAADRATPG